MGWGHFRGWVLFLKIQDKISQGIVNNITTLISTFEVILLSKLMPPLPPSPLNDRPREDFDLPTGHLRGVKSQSFLMGKSLSHPYKNPHYRGGEIPRWYQISGA